MLIQTNVHQKTARLKPLKRPICSHLHQTTQRPKQPFLFFLLSWVNGLNPLIGTGRNRDDLTAIGVSCFLCVCKSGGFLSCLCLFLR